MEDDGMFSIEKFILKINENEGVVVKNNDQNAQITNYNFELMLSEKILQMRFGLPNEAEKYKNNYSLEKLLHKEPKLSYFFENVKQLKDKISEYMNQKNYELKVYEKRCFVYIKFNFNLFENPLHNFYLELFLYKSDSTHSRILVNDLTEKLGAVMKKNEELRERHLNTISKLKKIKEENKKILNQVTEFQSIQTDKYSDMLNETIENTELRLIDLENNIINLKFELINSGENLRKNNKLVYLPIMRTEDKKLLAKWFGKDFELIMAYDSSKMGDLSVVFHEKCNGKIQTLTLIETENGRRFGGYTKLSWDLDGKESFKGGDTSAFIFSLDQKFKLDNVDEENVIFSSTKAGPKFGKHDIVISDEFTKNCNSYSCVFNSYGRKEQYEKEVKIEKNLNASTLLAGIEFFKVIKIEVFQVIFK